MVPEALIERIAARVAELLSDRRRRQELAGVPPYLSVPEAAELMRAKPQRIYDLLSSGRLTRFKDGSRVLVSRAEIDAYLAGEAPRGTVRTATDG
jgi:excisionase family DNA binding protein